MNRKNYVDFLFTDKFGISKIFFEPLLISIQSSKATWPEWKIPKNSLWSWHPRQKKGFMLKLDNLTLWASDPIYTGWDIKNGPLSFRSSDYIFAQIASIYCNKLFIMNLSFKGGTVHLYRSIRIEVTHQNVFSVRSQLLRFWTKFKGLRICMRSDLIFDLRGSQQ